MNFLVFGDRLGKVSKTVHLRIEAASPYIYTFILYFLTYAMVKKDIIFPNSYFSSNYNNRKDYPESIAAFRPYDLNLIVL